MTVLSTGFSRLVLVLAAAVVLAGALPAQSADAQAVSFEVASVRPAAVAREGGEGSSRSQIEAAPDGVTMRNVDLTEMIEWAYGLQAYQVARPSVLENERYDIRARAADRVSDNALKRMMQDLLATRFKLRFHREPKTTAVYELVVAKGGPKLPKDKTDTLPPAYAKESLPRVVDGGFVFSNVSMGEFAQELTELRGIDLPVVDRTGIAGVYDITLKGAASAVLDPQGPSLLTLIQEQLGLRLVSAKDPVEVMLVDHAEKPAAD
jgi:uncharacterized protein (TIGR03435 family)